MLRAYLGAVQSVHYSTLLSCTVLYWCTGRILYGTVLSCSVLSCLVWWCLILSLSCPCLVLVLYCLVVSCLVISCPVLSCLSRYNFGRVRSIFTAEGCFMLSRLPFSFFLHATESTLTTPLRPDRYHATPFHPPVRACVPCVSLRLALSWLWLEQGQKLAILGPNGAGKSTLLKALAGVLPLSEGERNEGEGLKLGVFTQVRKHFRLTTVHCNQVII